ncbi:MAG: HTH domain-containing protein [Clostridia bacterium]|nr:HTH domain-containing protein [Clostridia bacterium]
MKQYLTFAILLELVSKQFTTAKYISNKFEISIRSVYRYLNELESAGIPTYSIQGKNGGIGIEKNFVLNSIVLSDLEKQTLKEILQKNNSSACNLLIKKLLL